MWVLTLSPSHSRTDTVPLGCPWRPMRCLWKDSRRRRTHQSSLLGRQDALSDDAHDSTHVHSPERPTTSYRGVDQEVREGRQMVAKRSHQCGRQAHRRASEGGVAPKPCHTRSDMGCPCATCRRKGARRNGGEGSVYVSILCLFSSLLQTDLSADVWVSARKMPLQVPEYSWRAL